MREWSPYPKHDNRQLQKDWTRTKYDLSRLEFELRGKVETAWTNTA